MNPMAEARGLQLPRNDKGAAYGCMTAARQNRNPAASAPSGAWVRNRGMETRLLTLDILRWRRFPPATRRMFSFHGAVSTVVPGGPGCLCTQAVYHTREETALPPHA